MFVWYSGKRFQSETPMSLDSAVRLAKTSAKTHRNSRICDVQAKFLLSGPAQRPVQMEQPRYTVSK